MPDLRLRPHGMVFKGGGGDTETVESIPDWYKPFIEKGANAASDALDAGSLSTVVGLNDNQNKALSGMEGAATRADSNYNTAANATGVLTDAASGKGIYGAGATQGLKDSAIRDAQSAFAPVGSQLAAQGQVGGARAALLGQERDANLTSELASIDYQDLSDRRATGTSAANSIINNTGDMNTAAGAGASILGEAGGIEQEQGQREADATYQGLSRFASLLSGAPQPGQQAVQGGK